MNLVITVVDALSTDIPPFLREFALKGAALLILAAMSVLILRKASAATRHLVWLFALGGLLVLPAMSALLPGWAVLPRLNNPRENSELISAAKPLPAPSGQIAAVAVELSATPAPQNVPIGKITPIRSYPIGDWLMLAWMAGCAVLLLRLAAAQWLLLRAESRCKVVPDGRLEAAKQDVLRQLNIRRPVRLLLDCRRTIPIAWGVFRPRVLLPAEAVDWDELRLRAVLLHEMAHVKRGDPTVRWLSQLSCAIHWYNPLAWFAASRLIIEGEHACDDLVLTNGVRASDYAKQLLHVATNLSCPRMTRAVGLAMASPSQLERRVLAVLNQGVNRRRVTGPLALAALTLCLCAMVPLAMLRGAPDVTSTVADKSPDNFQNTNDSESAALKKAVLWELMATGTDEVKRITLREAEIKWERATELRGRNLISETDFDKARTEMEIARADFASRKDEVARIKLTGAETELARLEELRKGSLVSQGAVDQAKYQVAVLRAEMRGDAVEVARVRLRQAEEELEQATQLREQKVIPETEYDNARQRVALLRAELQQSANETPATKASTDETETLLKAIEEARAKALAVELKSREAGKDPGWGVFNAARLERDKQLATARNQSERLIVYERYAQEAADREREVLKQVEVGAQSPGIAKIARYETLLAQFELAQAKARTSGPAPRPAGQILVEAKVIEAPANERIPDDPSKIGSGKGINVLSSPRALTRIGEEAEIFIGQELPMNAAPGATEYIRTGVSIRVTPKLKGDRIAYTARLTLRDLVHSEAKETQTITETSARELHLSGTAQDGEGTWFRFSEYRNEKKSAVRAVWLRFTRQRS